MKLIIPVMLKKYKISPTPNLQRTIFHAAVQGHIYHMIDRVEHRKLTSILLCIYLCMI